MAAACNAEEGPETETTSVLSNDLLEAQIVAQAITELQEIQAPVVQVSNGSATVSVGTGNSNEETPVGNEDHPAQTAHVIYYIEDGTIARTEDRTLVDSAVQANDYEIERRSGRLPARKRVIPFKFRDYKNTSDDNTSDSDYEPPEQKPKIKRTPKPPAPVASKGKDEGTSNELTSGKQSRVGRPRKNFMPPQSAMEPASAILDQIVSPELERKYQEALKFSHVLAQTANPATCSKAAAEENESGDSGEPSETPETKEQLADDAADDATSAASDPEASTTEESTSKEEMSESVSVQGGVGVSTRRARVLRENKDPSFEYTPTISKKGRGRPRGDSWLKYYKCPDCGKTFNQKGNLRVHLRVHTADRPYTCLEEGCGKAFRSNESLRRHLLSHQGIKPFECDICHNKFSSNVALTEHRSRHFDEKPHPCPHCERRFRQVSCLRRHVATHSSDMPYECNICHRRFAQAAYLRSHIKVHTGEKPFNCEMCGKRFAHQSDVKRHRTTHTGEKPYSCSKCSAKFSDVSSKNRHEKEHENYKRYECHLCNDTFKRSGQLRSHLNRKHSHSFALKIEKDSVSGAFTLKMGDEVDPNSIQVTQQRIVSLIKNLHTKTVTEGFTEIENLPVVSIANTGNQSEMVAMTSDNVTDISQLDREVDPSVIEGDISVPIELQGVEIQGEDASQTYIAITDFAEEWVGKETEDGQPAECRYKILYEIGDDGTQKQVLVPFHQSEEDAGNIQVEYTELVSKINAQDQIVTSEEAIISLPSTNMVDESVEPEEQMPILASSDDTAGDAAEDKGGTLLNTSEGEAVYSNDTETVDEPSGENETDGPKGDKQNLSSNSNDGAVDYVSSPDFSSQEYYNWLTNFTELCKVVPMPLDTVLFQKISQVHKTLSDVMATPSGVIAERENFRVLMNISKELSTILNEHLVYVLENLNPDEAMKEEIENI